MPQSDCEAWKILAQAVWAFLSLLGLAAVVWASGRAERGNR
jgi:hypothetical protein